MTIGQRIMNYRKDKKLSQEEVAEKLNVTRQTVSKWETDQSTPDFDKIIPLCELFEISSEELLRGKEEKKEETKEENEQIQIDVNKEKRTKGLIISILLYFISVMWIMISIPVLFMNPIVASAIFLLICGVATCVLIYSRIMYKKEKPKEEIKQNRLYKQIDGILGFLTLIIYLGISFLTFAWHITWIIWLIYGFVMQIIKLIISLKGETYEK